MPKISPLVFDPASAFISPHGITQVQFDGLKEKLVACRNQVLFEDTQMDADSIKIPDEKRSSGARFLEMPERMLDVYQSDRESSDLGRILKTASRLGELVDKVVVLGIGGSSSGAGALMKACCHPYHNELGRDQRGGKPRLYFAGNNIDNDRSQGLLEFLEFDSRGDGLEGKWAIVVISHRGDPLETAVSFRQFYNKLKLLVGEKQLADYVVPVTCETSKLASLADAIDCKERYLIPEGIGNRFGVFSAVGLLPAAILGIDVVKLLESASAMNTHFRTAKMGQNAVMDYVAVNHLLRKKGFSTRVFSAWSKSLESVGFWYDRLLTESLGKHEKGALPLTYVNSRDLHSRGHQHLEGALNKVINNLTVGSWRSDPLPVGESQWNQDKLNSISDKTLPQIMDATVKGTNRIYKEDGCPTTNLHIHAANEEGLGQLLQMLMLATVLEGRLVGVNPYRQSGGENYKRYLNKSWVEDVAS
jgi:glucose-6-phosphate isomerase